ncbi:hypothetical protein Pelo_9741 [Pelomyxa schiedti]|nr:hypothetical protein Pelo_9741 [Pelomyxa schiedti]
MSGVSVVSLDLLSTYRGSLDRESDLSDALRLKAKTLFTHSRAISCATNMLHTKANKNSAAEALVIEKLRGHLSDAKTVVIELSSCIPPGMFYKYMFHWRTQITHLKRLSLLGRLLETNLGLGCWCSFSGVAGA